MRHVPPNEITKADTLERAIVLVRIDKNSRIEILSSADVLVAYLDEREAHNAAVILPRQDQANEIMAALAYRHLVGVGDAKGITANTISRLARQAVIVAGMKEGK